MTESQSTPALGDRRKQRRVAIAAISTGVVGLVVVLIIVLGGDNNKSVAQSTASSTAVVAVPTSTSAATSAPSVHVVSTTTTASTTESTTITTVADSSVASTTTQAPTSSTEASTEASATPTTATPSTVAPVTAPSITAEPVTPVTSAPVGNCTNVGAISIPATKTLQPILAETQQYSDGLLCGNHKSDHVDPGVDILPGFAPFAESVAGGPDLIGKVPAVIFGHRNSHNRPFYSIDKLQQGDAVSILDLDGSTIDLKVDTVVLMSLADATTTLLAPSTNGDPQLRLVACSHADGTPGGVNYRWIATLVKA